MHTNNSEIMKKKQPVTAENAKAHQMVVASFHQVAAGLSSQAVEVEIHPFHPLVVPGLEAWACLGVEEAFVLVEVLLVVAAGFQLYLVLHTSDKI